MATKIPKFYKTRTVEISGNEVELRAWRSGDGALVAKVMKLQLEIEGISKKDHEEDPTKYFRLLTQQQDCAMVLAKRALKRAYIPECRSMQAEDIDDFECENLDEIDPVDALKITNVMIDLGIPESVKSKEAKPGKKSDKKKNSTKKSS